MKTPRTTNLLLAAAALALLACVAPPHAAAQRPEAQKSADEKFERGRRLYQQGDAASAIPLLRDAAEHRKTDADAWYYLGLALSRAGRAKDARSAFEKTLKLRPGDAGAHTGLAYSLLFLHKPRDAEREAGEALRLNPQMAEAHYVVGVVRFTEGKFEQAVGEAEAGLRLKPDFPAAAYLAGDSLLSLYVEARVRQDVPAPAAPRDAKDDAVFVKPLGAADALKARMLAAAERLDAFVRAQPDNPDAEQWRDQAATLRHYGGPAGDGKSSGVYRQSEVTTRAVILAKPQPGFTELARGNGVTGVVRLLAVLAADARVRYILVLKRLPDGLTEKSIEAARKIRFTPATINGQPVSQFVVLEYNFNIY
jgi:tetratricopeptide (TPR) repeat protein